MQSRKMKKQNGIVLLEVLIAILIFAFGVLGLIGLQATMTKAQSGSKYRADAANLASDLFALIQTDNIANIGKYTTAACSGYARCADWASNVQTRLPNGAFTSTVTTTSGSVQVQLTWSQPGAEQNNYTTTMLWQQ